jgi:Glycosyl transferase family 2
VVPGGLVAFHDYADYYPGVQTFVDELLAAGRYEKVHLARSLMVVRRRPSAPVQPAVQAPAVAVRKPAKRAAAAIEAPPAVRLPLVSCIMPTADRRPFVPLALRQFQRQDWPAACSELIVLDDGDDPVADLMPDDPRVRYVRLDRRTSVGAKRNLACDMARGEVILHWDDDDWMEERRIRFQVESLLAGKADLCGLSRLYYHDPESGRSWEYTCMRRDKLWLAGATFCYRKELWLGSPFPDLNNGEDSRFLWSDRQKKVLPLRDSGFYVARIHAANTGSRVGTGPGWRPLPAGVVPGFLNQVANPPR